MTRETRRKLMTAIVIAFTLLTLLIIVHNHAKQLTITEINMSTICGTLLGTILLFGLD